jgi:hypothetical protein
MRWWLNEPCFGEISADGISWTIVTDIRQLPRVPGYIIGDGKIKLLKLAHKCVEKMQEYGGGRYANLVSKDMLVSNLYTLSTTTLFYSCHVCII